MTLDLSYSQLKFFISLCLLFTACVLVPLISENTSHNLHSLQNCVVATGAGDPWQWKAICCCLRCGPAHGGEVFQVKTPQVNTSIGCLCFLMHGWKCSFRCCAVFVIGIGVVLLHICCVQVLRRLGWQMGGKDHSHRWRLLLLHQTWTHRGLWTDHTGEGVERSSAHLSKTNII